MSFLSFLPLFFHAPLPFSSSLAELSARLRCCSRAALLASWRTRAEGEDCQGTCPLAEGQRSSASLDSRQSERPVAHRSFSLRARSPVCSLRTVTGFQTKRLLVPADPLLLPHSRGLACRRLGLVGVPTVEQHPGDCGCFGEHGCAAIVPAAQPVACCIDWKRVTVWVGELRSALPAFHCYDLFFIPSACETIGP